MSRNPLGGVEQYPLPSEYPLREELPYATPSRNRDSAERNQDLHHGCKDQEIVLADWKSTKFFAENETYTRATWMRTHGWPLGARCSIAMAVLASTCAPAAPCSRLPRSLMRSLPATCREARPSRQGTRCRPSHMQSPAHAEGKGIRLLGFVAPAPGARGAGR